MSHWLCITKVEEISSASMPYLSEAIAECLRHYDAVVIELCLEPVNKVSVDVLLYITVTVILIYMNVFDTIITIYYYTLTPS